MGSKATVTQKDQDGMVYQEGVFVFTVYPHGRGEVCTCCADPGQYKTLCSDDIWPDQDITEAETDRYTQAVVKLSQPVNHGNHGVSREVHLAAACGYLRRLAALLETITSRKILIVSLLDSDGGTALHTALRKKQSEAAKVLIQYGGKDLVLHHFTESKRYRGVTSLHLAVGNGEVEVVDMMMGILDGEERQALANTQAYGDLFRDQLRLSGLPLALSLHGHQPELLEKLVRYGARVDSRDLTTGNTVMHTIIEIGLQDPDQAKTTMDLVLNSEAMLEWWSEKRGLPVSSSNKAEVARCHKYLLGIKNFDGYTPLTLAAKLGAPEMLTYMLEKEGVYRFTRWAYGHVSIANYDMNEVDPIITGRTRPSVIELLVFSAPDGVLPVFNCPAIKRLIDAKWRQTWFFFMAWFVYHSGVMCLLTTAAVSGPTGHNVSDMRAFSKHDMALSTGEILILLTAVLYCLMALKKLSSSLVRLGMDLCHKRRNKYFSSTYKLIWRLDPFEFVSLLFGVSLVCRGVMMVGATPFWDILLAIALASGWFYTLSFTRAFEVSSFFTLMIHKMLIGDMLRFACVFFILLIGFGTAMRVLYMETDKEMPLDFDSLSAALLSMFRLLTGLKDVSNLDRARSASAATFFYVVFICVASVLLLNMLIAAMSDTYATVARNSHTLFLKSRLLSIFQCEENLPFVFGTKRTLRKYMTYSVHTDKWELEVESA